MLKQGGIISKIAKGMPRGLGAARVASLTGSPVALVSGRGVHTVPDLTPTAINNITKGYVYDTNTH